MYLFVRPGTSHYQCLAVVWLIRRCQVLSDLFGFAFFAFFFCLFSFFFSELLFFSFLFFKNRTLVLLSTTATATTNQIYINGCG